MKPGALNILMAVSLFSGAAMGQQNQTTITKCQDKDGKWHYGDFAAEACARDSKITEIDQRGVQVRQTDAPPTQEELDAKKEAEEQARLEAERRAAQKKEDTRLLQTYDSAQAIIDARDERVAATERDIESHRLFRQDLVDDKEELVKKGGDDNAGKIIDLEEQIRQYDQAIEALQSQKQSTMEEYNTVLERYRELTGG